MTDDGGLLGGGRLLGGRVLDGRRHLVDGKGLQLRNQLLDGLLNNRNEIHQSELTDSGS